MLCRHGAITNFASMRQLVFAHLVSNLDSLADFHVLQVKHFGKEMVGAPIQRPAQPKEYGPVAIFLADEAQSSYILGAVIAVTGGMLIS